MSYHGFPSREAYDRAKQSQAELVIPRDMERFVGERVAVIAAQHWKSTDRIAEEAYLQGIIDAALQPAPSGRGRTAEQTK